MNKSTTDTTRTDAYQYANYILNHYDPSSHKDKLCLTKSLIEHGYGAAKPKLTRESYDENWNMKQADTPRTDSWECFSDPSYYDMARLRRTDGPKDFNTGYHLNNLREAVEVRDILNELERRAEKAEAEVERLRQHERELNEAKAEVERLKENLEIAEENLVSLRMSLAQEEKRAIHFQHYCKKAQDMYNYHLVATSEADERAEKAEANVERLKKMVIEAAELGDKRSENFKARAEKAEASLIKINEELCQAGLREYGN